MAKHDGCGRTGTSLRRVEGTVAKSYRRICIYEAEQSVKALRHACIKLRADREVVLETANLN